MDQRWSATTATLRMEVGADALWQLETLRAQFDVNQFRDGMNTELTAGTYNPVTHFASDDPILVGKVVRAHLNKTSDYYTQWAAGEKAAEREYGHKPVMQPRLAQTG
jgi:Protein of unknown function (DUF5661)